MNHQLPTISQIRVIIWDLDGTLYTLTPEITAALRRAQYRVISNHTGWEVDRSEAEFHNLYPSQSASSSAVVSRLSGITIAQAGQEVEAIYSRIEFIRWDERLISLFKGLTHYRHYVLSNGYTPGIVSCLKHLGINPALFEGIVGIDTVSAVKPDPAGFTFILTKTGLPPAAHCMIGDRDSVDIKPAKSLGMRTIFVWGTSSIADYFVPTVYDVPACLARLNHVNGDEPRVP